MDKKLSLTMLNTFRRLKELVYQIYTNTRLQEVTWGGAL